MNCCADLCEYLFESYDTSADTADASARLQLVEAKTIEQALRTDTGTGNGASYKIKQLFNKHGYNLAILPGHVKGKILKIFWNRYNSSIKWKEFYENALRHFIWVKVY